MKKSLVLAFSIPVLIAVFFILGYDYIVPPDPNLVRAKDGLVYAPYDGYQTRDIDFYYQLFIGSLFILGAFLPLLIWHRNRQH